MSEPVITVRGEGRRKGPPDLATLSITVHAQAATADQVRSELAAASNQLRPILDARQASLESTSTSGSHVGPIFRARGAKISGFQGSVSTTVVVKDLASISDLVLAMAPLDRASLDGPWWSLRADNPLHREARLAAIDDAQRRAGDYAAAFGGTVGDVLEISDLDSGFGGGPVRLGMAAKFADSEDASFDVEPALQEVVGQVTVRFALVLPG